METRLIQNYEHLPHLPRAAHALTMLRRLASLVKPLMVSHSFRVGTLSEFFPDQSNLLGLNVNAGQRIHIRLRHSYDSSSFLPEEDIVDIMLHELTHNLYGPHDEQFYGFLKKLEGEYHSLRARGWNGEGFYSDGRRLGGKELPLRDMRLRALKAIEARAKLVQGSGQKLGGGGGGAGPSRWRQLRDVIADATEWRLRDQKSCGAGNKALAEESMRGGFRTKAEEDDANEMAIIKAQMEMIEEDEKRGWRDEGGFIWIDDDNDVLPVAGPSSAVDQGGAWTCRLCTLVNQPTFLNCDACLTQRPGQKQKQKAPAVVQPPATKPFLSKSSEAILRTPEIKRPPKNWRCHRCAVLNEEIWWTCTSCGTMKLSS